MSDTPNKNTSNNHQQGSVVYYNDKGHLTKAIFLYMAGGVASVFPLSPYTDMILKIPNDQLFDSLEACTQAAIEACKQDYMEQMYKLKPIVKAEPQEAATDIDTVTMPMSLSKALETGMPYVYAKINIKVAGSFPVMVKASLTPDGNPRFRYRNKGDMKTQDPGWSVCYVSRSYYHQTIWCISEKDAERFYNECHADELNLEAE